MLQRFRLVFARASTPSFDNQQFTVFIVETSQTADAQTLLRLSQSEDARGHCMIGVAADRLFALIVARAFTDGVEAYETPKSLARFREELTKILVTSAATPASPELPRSKP